MLMQNGGLMNFRSLHLQFLLGFLLLNSFTTPSFANNVQDKLFDRFKGDAEHWSDVGKICERVAQADFEDRFPSHSYEVMSGVVYTSSETHGTLGELDLVV